MASTYDLKYLPPKKGDEWKPESLVGAIDRISSFTKLNPKSGKDLETIANSYIGSEVLNLSSEEEVEQVVGEYKNTLASSINDYVIGNLKSAVKYSDQQKLIPIALNLPVKKRKAKDGETLSEEDNKYNAAVDAILKFRAISEARQSKEGLEKEVQKELEGINEPSRAFWLKVLTPQGVYEHRKKKAVGSAIKKVMDFGLAQYLSEAVKISDSAEKEFSEKSKSLSAKLNAEIAERAAKVGSAPTPQEIGMIRDKYQEEGAKLQKEYSALMGARQFIVNGSEEQGMPGLIALVQDKYKKEQAAAKRKAEEEAKKKAA